MSDASEQTLAERIAADDRPGHGIVLDVQLPSGPGGHVRVKVWAGQEGSPGLAGELTLRREEWVAFAAVLNLGIGAMQAQPSLFDSLYVLTERPVSRPAVTIRYQGDETDPLDPIADALDI